MRSSRRVVAALLGAAVVAGCAAAEVDGPDDGGAGVAEAPAAEGEPGAATRDDTVTIVDAVLTGRDDGSRRYDLAIQVRNDGDTSRRVVLPVGPPRIEPLDVGVRLSWLRTAVEASDAATGEVTYDRSVPFVDAVSIGARETWDPQELSIDDPGRDLAEATELCLEVMPLPPEGTPAEREPTGEIGPVRAGWEDGEPVLLACGPLRVEPAA